MNPLHDAIVARLPASMRELAEHTGVDGQPLWDVVETLRKAAVLRRIGPHGARVYVLPFAETPATEAEGDPPAPAQEKKQRKRPVILFFIPGWPAQEPNRRMVWKICWNGEASAQWELRRVKKYLKKDAEWELASMTPVQIKRLRVKGYSLLAAKDRAKTDALCAKADAAAS